MKPAQALENFLDTWSDGILLNDLGPHLSCTECNALADLLRAHGHDSAAASLVEGHCLSDDEGDDADHFALRQKLESDSHGLLTIAPLFPRTE